MVESVRFVCVLTYTYKNIFAVGVEVFTVSRHFQFTRDLGVRRIGKIKSEKRIDGSEGYYVSGVSREACGIYPFSLSKTSKLTDELASNFSHYGFNRLGFTDVIELIATSANVVKEEDGCVTVRDRDTMQQERVKIDELVSYIEAKLEF